MELAQGSVYVVDDDADVCDSISRVLSSVGYQVKTYSTAETFLNDGVDSQPHCVIVDLLLPGMTGLKLCRKSLASNSACGFIVITGNGDVSSAVDAMKMGAVDFLEKPFGQERRLESVHEAVRAVHERHLARQEEEEARVRLSELTPRELDIFTKVAAGLPTKAIANACGISTRTVDVHRSRILKKLRIESSMQLAHFIAMLDRGSNGRIIWASA